jgi:hypothetical protein
MHKSILLNQRQGAEINTILENAKQRTGVVTELIQAAVVEELNENPFGNYGTLTYKVPESPPRSLEQSNPLSIRNHDDRAHSPVELKFYFK